MLLYHVAGGARRATQLLDEGSAATLQGGSVTVGFAAGKVTVNDASIINPDINAPNGLIQVIDQVLLP